MYKSIPLLTSALLFFAPLSALADEVWTSEQYGEIIYGAEVEDTAVFYMPGSHPGSTVYLYLPGLAGNSTTRGTYTGYWIETAAGACATLKTGIDGLSSDNWGTLEVVFATPAFPSGFTMRLGACDGAYTDEALATPLTN